MSKQDPFEAVTRLINSALTTAKIFGENQRASRLAASSVGRFMQELDASPGGRPGLELLEHALDLIDEEQEENVPLLMRGLASLRKA